MLQNASVQPCWCFLAAVAQSLGLQTSPSLFHIVHHKRKADLEVKLTSRSAFLHSWDYNWLPSSISKSFGNVVPECLPQRFTFSLSPRTSLARRGSLVVIASTLRAAICSICSRLLTVQTLVLIPRSCACSIHSGLSVITFLW